MVDGIFGRMSRFSMSIHRIAKCSSIIYRKIATNGYKVKQQCCLPFTNNRMYRWKERKKNYIHIEIELPFWFQLIVQCTHLLSIKSQHFFRSFTYNIDRARLADRIGEKNRLTKYEFRWRSSRHICDAWIFFDFEIFKWNTRKQLQYWNS